MDKDQFVDDYSKNGHRDDPMCLSYKTGAFKSIRRWSLAKVQQYFEAVSCDCGEQQCQEWKMKAIGYPAPDNCSVDPMTTFGPFGPPFTMMDKTDEIRLLPGGVDTGMGSGLPNPVGLRGSDFPFHWHFVLDGKTVGELTFNEETEKLDFSGDVHASAQILFDLVTERFAAWYKEKYGE